jgi:hypothetical protein
MTDSQATITIPFPFPPEDHSCTTLEKCYAFWDLPSTVEWFKHRGYTLYKRKETEFDDEFEPNMYPVLECPRSGEIDYPFPYYDPGRVNNDKLSGEIFNVNLLVVGAYMTNPFVSDRES